MTPFVGLTTAQSGLGLSVSVPDTGTAGEDIQIGSTVEVPDVLGDHEADVGLTLYVDGTEVANKTVTVTDGESADLTFSHAFSEAGTHDIRVEASTSVSGQSFSTDATGSIDIESRSLGSLDLSVTAPDSTTPGTSTDLTVTLGLPDAAGVGASGEIEVSVRANGETKASGTAMVSPGNATSITLSPTFDQTGDVQMKIEASGTLNGQSLSSSTQKTIAVRAPMTPELTLDASVPSETDVNTDTDISVAVGGTDLPTTTSGEVTLELVADGETIATETVTLSGEGDSSTVDLTAVFNQTGETTLELVATATMGGESLSKSLERTISVNSERVLREQVKGAAFPTPESLEDEVEAYRDDAGLGDRLKAFVLATQSETYVVFTEQTPQKGLAVVTGPKANRTIRANGTSFGVMAASTVSFETEGQDATISEIQAQSGEYRMDLVRISATYRRATTLTDPDEGENLTASTTSGILVEDPRTAVSMFKNAGTQAQTLSRAGNASSIDAVLEDPRREHLHTFTFETGFWTDTEATVDALVLDPSSTAYEYATTFGSGDLVHGERGEPLLYVVEHDFGQQEVESVSSINERGEELDGEVVELNARLYQQQVSVQETLEHATTTVCGETMLQVQTPQGPTCVNVVQDVLAHGGVAWTTVPQSRDDVMWVFGLSSRHQDSPNEFVEGRYRIVGEVVSTSRIDDSLPEGSVLLVYELEKTGEIDYGGVVQEGRALIEDRTGSLSGQLQMQIRSQLPRPGKANATIARVEAGETVSARFESTETVRTGVSDVSLTTSDSMQDVTVSVQEVPRQPDSVSTPPAETVRMLNISTSVSDDSIDSARFTVNISKGTIPEDAELQVYRYHDGDWRALSTTVQAESSTAITLDVETPGFSYFSVGYSSAISSQNDQSSDSESDSSTESSANDSSDGEDNPATTSSDGPGFTLGVSLFALLAIGFLLRQRDI